MPTTYTESWNELKRLGTVFVVGDVVTHKFGTFTCATGHTAADADEPPGAKWTGSVPDAFDDPYLVGETAVSSPVFGFIPGKYYTTPGVNVVSSASAITCADGTLFSTLFVCPREATFDRIGVHVITAGAGGTLIRLGVYALDVLTGDPGALVLDAGTVAGDSTGAKEITIDETLPAGYYLLALKAEGGAPATIQINTPSTSVLGTQTVGGMASIGWDKASVGSGALPDPFPSTPTAATAGTGRKVVLRVSS